VNAKPRRRLNAEWTDRPEPRPTGARRCPAMAAVRASTPLSTLDRRHALPQPFPFISIRAARPSEQHGSCAATDEHRSPRRTIHHPHGVSGRRATSPDGRGFVIDQVVGSTGAAGTVGEIRKHPGMILNSVDVLKWPDLTMQICSSRVVFERAGAPAAWGLPGHTTRGARSTDTGMNHR
jgi:hypothetical protein